MRMTRVGTRMLVVAAVSFPNACRPPGSPPGGGDWPRVDTAGVTIGALEYSVKLDGTVHFQGSPVHFTVTAQPASPTVPPVTRIEAVLTQPGAADPVVQTAHPARWVATSARCDVDIRNAFPGPEPGHAVGRRFVAGTYLLRVDLYEGEKCVGQIGPLEIYLGYQRTRE